jgi:4-diphosphocytidyl-2-C-methyl-D-erythritol kinase
MRLQQSGRSWVLHTPAKLNLYLEVLAKRDDGFHELLTLMTKVSLFDTLVFTPQSRATGLSANANFSVNTQTTGNFPTQESTNLISLSCRDVSSGIRQNLQSGQEVHHVPTGQDNLAVRAAELLLERTGNQPSRGCSNRANDTTSAQSQYGIHIDLYKRIPAAAGLAGGSSDAAGVLFALNRIWDLNLSRDRLQEIASELGSDVSFFLSQTPAAICRGRGEMIEPLGLSHHLYFVVAKPHSGLSTPLVFKNLTPNDFPHHQKSSESTGINDLIQALASGDVFSAGCRMKNTLQSPAEALNPDINRLRAIFSRLSVVGHMMSGSGTSYFGLCLNKKHAQQVASQLKAIGEDSIFVVETPPG